MIQPRTMLEVADNSGAKKVQCIRVMGGSNKKYATIGDTIIVAVKEASPEGSVKKGEVARAVVASADADAVTVADDETGLHAGDSADEAATYRHGRPVRTLILVVGLVLVVLFTLGRVLLLGN